MVTSKISSNAWIEPTEDIIKPDLHKCFDICHVTRKQLLKASIAISHQIPPTILKAGDLDAIQRAVADNMKMIHLVDKDYRERIKLTKDVEGLQRINEQMLSVLRRIDGRQ